MKECLSAPEIIEHLEEGLLSISKDIQVSKLPLADGGDGMLAAFKTMKDGELIELELEDPIGRSIQSQYLKIDEDTAVIEMALISGLALLQTSEQDVMKTSTYGMGQAIHHAMENGVRKFIVGIGGSATNDVGAGMAQALGYTLHGLDNAKANGSNLNLVTGIELSEHHELLQECEFRIACDVRNPLFGSNGCSYIFSPQKGASAEQVQILEKNVEHFANILDQMTDTSFRDFPGVGAAGGIGYLFKSLLGAELVPGAELILDAIQFDTIIQNADLVITAEGALDSQTAEGKLPQIVAQKSQNLGIPCIALCGCLKPGWEILHQDGLIACSIAPGPISLGESIEKAGAYLQQSCREMVRSFLAGRRYLEFQ